MYVKKLVVMLVVVALLMTATPAAMATESDSAWDQVKAAGSDIWGTVKEKAPGVWEKTKDKASDLYDKAKEKAPEVREKVQSSVSKAQEKISDYNARQQEEFWQRFEAQTTGSSAKAAVNSDSAGKSENNAAQIVSDTDSAPALPGETESPDAPRADEGDELQDDTGEMPAEVLEKYAEGEIYYYRPNDTAHEASNPEEPEYAGPTEEELEELEKIPPQTRALANTMTHESSAIKDGIIVLLLIALVVMAYLLGERKHLGLRMHFAVSNWWDGVRSSLRRRR